MTEKIITDGPQDDQAIGYLPADGLSFSAAQEMEKASTEVLLPEGAAAAPVPVAPSLFPAEPVEPLPPRQDTAAKGRGRPRVNKPPKPVKPPKEPTPRSDNRKVVSVTFQIPEFDYLKEVYEARQQQGLSDNWNHFLRQCINYAVNWEKGWQFGVPKNIEKIHFA